MSKENAKQPAFPMLDMNSVQGQAVLQLRYEGLTKREYFVGLIFASRMTSEGYGRGGLGTADERLRYEAAALSIKDADELLKQLSNE